jgi:hypothetical protein
MPILGSFGAGSKGGYGQRKGGAKKYDIDFLVIAGGASGGGRDRWRSVEVLEDLELPLKKLA